MLDLFATVVASVSRCMQVAEGVEQKASLEKQLPRIMQHMSRALQNHSNRILIASSQGFEGEAAVVAAAHAAEQNGQGIYNALVHLQHCHHMLRVCECTLQANMTPCNVYICCVMPCIIRALSVAWEA